ncbi:ParB N-terminal domain-containing protein [Streptomyces sp. NPDC091292]|uniref:ParB N-terminal domain-containing protein n=1 Tax=Streptomyces sp. NPDC091292 TaxID=3365991 RepID=UPI0037F351FB
MTKKVGIHEIKAGDRARTDLGDLTDLMTSIEALGLFQPIVVTAENKLIAGGRRLEACRRLGMDEVQVVVAEHIHDAVDLLKAERDENICRKPMTASELIALGRQIEELEKPRAAERKAASQLAGRSPGGSPIGAVLANGTEKYDSRERAAEAVGLSTATYSRIKQVANGADGYEINKGQRTAVSPERQAASKTALDLMDRITAGEEVRPTDGGRPLTVTAVYEHWKGRKTNRGPEAPTTRSRPEPAAPAAPLLDAGGRRMPQRSQRKSITDGMAALSGLCVGFAGINELDESIDAEEAALWRRDLDQVLRVLRSFNNKLKEHVHATH